jgi:putative ABC transport system permease protein
MGRFLVVIVVGIIIGVMASLAATRLIKTLLFEVSALDPVTFVLTSALLAIAAIIAIFIPVRRAVKMSPSISLRID